jgi:hypothetical protein
MREPEPSFFDARPQRIEMKSLYLSEILQRPPQSIAEAMAEEFSQPTEV